MFRHMYELISSARFRPLVIYIFVFARVYLLYVHIGWTFANFVFLNMCHTLLEFIGHVQVRLKFHWSVYTSKFDLSFIHNV